MSRWTRVAERAAIGAGAVLLGAWGSARLHNAVAAEAAIYAFQQGAAARAVEESAVPEFPGWAERRIELFKLAIAKYSDPPAGVLRIPRLRLEAAVFEGVNSRSLNRGAGHIPGTAGVGTAGNVGLAGHRDGVFRVLKDIVEGDYVELDARDNRVSYVVRRMEVVEAEDTGPLSQELGGKLTLVTCYPFHYVGEAPQRYIVQCEKMTKGRDH